MMKGTILKMPLSHFKSYFKNEDEFEDFKTKNKDFLARYENLHSEFVKQGMSNTQASYVIYQKAYHPFLQVKQFYDKHQK